MKLKDLLNENVLGQLPSSKLMKMKWNPVTEAHHEEEPVEEAAPRMKKDISVEKVDHMRQIINRIENQMKAYERSRHSNMTREFANIHKSLDNLVHKLRKHPSIG